MDNKSYYKRLSTFFWWVVAVLPLLVALIQLLFQYFGANNQTYDSFIYYLEQFQNGFENALPSWLSDMYNNLYVTMGIQNNVFAFVISWFVYAYILELLVDIILWLPIFIHKLIDKVGE